MQACINAVRALFPSRKGAKKSRSKNEETPEPIDVLVDLIIGFMERSTTYLRAIGNQAFALLSGSVKQSTIELILMVLCKSILIFTLIDVFIVKATREA